jgi:hypothetical protein
VLCVVLEQVAAPGGDPATREQAEAGDQAETGEQAEALGLVATRDEAEALGLVATRDEAEALGLVATRGRMLVALDGSAGADDGAAATVPLVRRALSRDPGTLRHAWVPTAAMPDLRDALLADGLRPNRTGGEWMVLRTTPTEVVAERRLRVLTSDDREAAVACLAVSNPGTEAVPLAEGERWWGIDDATGGGLAGVIGAGWTTGTVGGAGSWHLHGLGVRPGVGVVGHVGRQRRRAPDLPPARLPHRAPDHHPAPALSTPRRPLTTGSVAAPPR